MQPLNYDDLHLYFRYRVKSEYLLTEFRELNERGDYHTYGAKKFYGVVLRVPITIPLEQLNDLDVVVHISPRIRNTKRSPDGVLVKTEHSYVAGFNMTLYPVTSVPELPNNLTIEDLPTFDIEVAIFRSKLLLMDSMGILCFDTQKNHIVGAVKFVPPKWIQ